jgi:zinc transport system permease protein
MEIFQMEFMQRALIVAVLISIITPLIGNVIVLKRLSTIGDALSHSGLAGVTIGLCIGVNPVLSAVIVAVLAAITIEYIRRAFPNYAEMATAIVLSFGVGLAAVFSGFVKNAATLNSFMFGSIVAISNFELWTVVILSAIVILVVLLLYRELFYVTFDEEGAALSGVPTRGVNLVFTILTAIVVSVAARTVGVLVISSLMVVPVACAMLVSHSYKQNLVLSVIFALCFTVTGLLVTAFYDIKPGGTIVLIGIAVLLVILLLHKRK